MITNKILSDYVNKRVKIVKSTSGHGATIGSTATVTSVNGNALRLKEFPSWSFYMHDLEICPMTRQEIGEGIKKLEAEIESERSKLQFMSDNNLEEYDETQFKVFQTLKTLDNKDLSQLERSKIIATLIQS